MEIMIDILSAAMVAKPFAALSVSEVVQILHWRQRCSLLNNAAPISMPTASILSACISSAIHKASCLLMPTIATRTEWRAEPAIGRQCWWCRNYRNKQLARALMQRALQEIAQRFGPLPVCLSAQVYLRDFYAGWGLLRRGGL